ncbi:unnamed protein product [Closterium sp. NIES-64]|nr:unnamed protein product [Closterium sp. NIES-64]
MNDIIPQGQCRYASACLDTTACPVEATCTTTQRGRTVCACPSGYRPLKQRVGDTAFSYCARSTCKRSNAFVGFSCAVHDEAAAGMSFFG